MSKAQTTDPGANHSNNSRNTGDFDFSGQDGYDTTGDGETTEVPVRRSNTSNPHNGSGGSSKTIDPAKVKGCNP